MTEKTHAQKLFSISERATENVVHNFALSIVQVAEKHAESTGAFSFDTEVNHSKFDPALVIHKLKSWGFDVRIIDTETYMGTSQTRISISWKNAGSQQNKPVDVVAPKVNQPIIDKTEKKHVVIIEEHDSWTIEDNGPIAQHIFESESQATKFVTEYNSKNNLPCAPEYFTKAYYLGHTTSRLIAHHKIG